MTSLTQSHFSEQSPNVLNKFAITGKSEFKTPAFIQLSSMQLVMWLLLTPTRAVTDLIPYRSFTGLL